MRPQHLALAVLTAAAPLGAAHAGRGAAKPAPATVTTSDVEVKAEGVSLTGAVAGRNKSRYRMVVAEKGTLLVSVEPIHGPAPKVRLLTAEGRTIRRGVRGKTWARPAAGTTLLLEVAPAYADETSTYHMSVAFEVDRPRPLRSQPRPLRPRDIARVAMQDVFDLDRVTVGGLNADYAVKGADVLISIPAFAREGTIELRSQSRPPRVVHVELIGTEDAKDRVTESCRVAEAGCIEILLSPSVNTPWLEAIARLLDADIARHIVATGALTLKLRSPASATYAIEQLRRMPGVLSAQRMQ